MYTNKFSHWEHQLSREGVRITFFSSVKMHVQTGNITDGTYKELCLHKDHDGKIYSDLHINKVKVVNTDPQRAVPYFLGKIVLEKSS